MSLSFVAGTTTLANWGFSSGDIATIAGAGRKIGNFIMAQRDDRSMLDFLAIDIDAVMTRKGFVDTDKLHKRWNTKLTLLKNGKPVHIRHPANSRKPVIENMDRFTWTMTLITSALDAALSPRSLNLVMSRFLTDLFQETTVGMDFLERELTKHIQGWHSSACVRGMLHRSGLIWSDLGRRKEHEPGLIPDGDNEEIFSLLRWITTGSTTDFHTASSDVFSLAKILGEIGIELSAVRKSKHEEDFSQSMRVTFSSELVPRDAKSIEKLPRCGMRVPLDHIEECVTLWSGTLGQTNDLRHMFDRGKDAVSLDGLYLEYLLGLDSIDCEIQDTWFAMRKSPDSSQEQRLEKFEALLTDTLLPPRAFVAAKTLGKILRRHPQDDLEVFRTALRRTTTTRNPWALVIENVDPLILAEAQAFLLGFYYKLLRPLVDTTLLTVPEVFGSWGLNDTQFLELLYHFIQCRTVNNAVIQFQRGGVMTLAGFLFAGLSLDAIYESQMPDVVGFVSRLTILTKATLGALASIEDVGKFVVLDVDATSVPCSTSGVVKYSKSHKLTRKSESIAEDRQISDAIRFENLEAGQEDFTVHLEPDWVNDVNCLVVTYRHLGRLVCRTFPKDLESGLRQAIWHSQCLSGYSQASKKAPSGVDCVKCFTRGKLADFQGGVARTGAPNALVISTRGCLHAQTCILSMSYLAGYRLYSQVIPEFHAVIVSSDQELVEAAAGGFRVILAAETTDQSIKSLPSILRNFETPKVYNVKYMNAAFHVSSEAQSTR